MRGWTIFLILGIVAWLVWGYVALTWHPLGDTAKSYQQYDYKPELAR